jgi:cation:H+ antiporter
MQYLLLVGGFILLFLSGNYLVKASVEIARRFKLSGLVIGITVVAFGTSAPELFVSLEAVFVGSPDISLSNVVGSNIANIALVLGLVALVFPIKVKKKGVWKDWAIMMLASFILVAATIGYEITRWEGALFIVLLVSYLAWLVIQSRKANANQVTDNTTENTPLTKSLILFLVAVTGLYFGAQWLVDGARTLALNLGVSEKVVGISVIAFGTSVPELATSLIAAIRKETDISIGNIIGSNIFNIWAILGITASIKPLSNINPEFMRFDYPWMMAISALLLILILPLARGIITRWKGALLLAIYGIYIYLLF